MKRFFWAAMCGISLLLTGCAPDLGLTDSDITVKELEKRMSKALDPKGRFASAQRFVQRFEVKTHIGWLEPPKEEFVEVKFSAPGNFKMTTSDEKGIHYAYIFNDDGGYTVDYRKKHIKPLSKELLSHLRTMREIADPVMELDTVFNHIEIQRGNSKGREFYRLRCRKTLKNNPLDLYISIPDYRLRSLTGNIKIGSAVLNYSSTVINYALIEGMMVADLTKSKTNGIKTESKLVYFKLNPHFPQDEFKIPVF